MVRLLCCRFADVEAVFIECRLLTRRKLGMRQKVSPFTIEIATHQKLREARSVSVVNLKVQKAKVTALGVGVAFVWGIPHDKITVRLCVEYFSLAHPPLFPVSSPTLLGLCWGIAATFGVGLILGFLLAQASQSSGLPPMALRNLLGPLLVVIAVTAAGAIVAGCIGLSLSWQGV